VSDAGYQETIVGDSPVLDEELIVEKYWEGGHRQVIDCLPGEDSHLDLKESHSKVGEPQVEYPRERDHYTVSKFTGYYNGRSRSEYKVFDIKIDREEHPDEAERIENLLSQLRRLPQLEEEISQYDCFEELEENAETVREYEALYGSLKSAWDNDSLASYATGKRSPLMFEVDQFPQGFYGVPRLFNGHADQLIGDKLEEEDLGSHSVVWGSFILKPEDFTAVHDLLEPFYHIPGDEVMSQ
jgi:hypothetical protein